MRGWLRLGSEWRIPAIASDAAALQEALAELDGAQARERCALFALGRIDRKGRMNVCVSVVTRKVSPKCLVQERIGSGNLAQSKEAMNSAVKVLIVEDEPHALMGLAELISGWGYRTETARDGIEGWEKALAWNPAIVVTDLKMPRLDGIGLLTKFAEEGSLATPRPPWSC